VVCGIVEAARCYRHKGGWVFHAAFRGQRHDFESRCHSHGTRLQMSRVNAIGGAPPGQAGPLFRTRHLIKAGAAFPCTSNENLWLCGAGIAQAFLRKPRGRFRNCQLDPWNVPWNRRMVYWYDSTGKSKLHTTMPFPNAKCHISIMPMIESSTHQRASTTFERGASGMAGTTVHC